MKEIGRSGIRASIQNGWIRVNIDLKIRRQHLWILMAVAGCLLLVFGFCPNEEIKKYLIDILLGALQLLWANSKK